MADPEDNTLAGDLVEETNVVDELITSEEHLLVDPEVAEAAPSLVVESLEELPATPLGDEEEEEDEDDMVEKDVNVLVEPPEPKGTITVVSIPIYLVNHTCWSLSLGASSGYMRSPKKNIHTR